MPTHCYHSNSLIDNIMNVMLSNRLSKLHDDQTGLLLAHSG